MTPGRLTTAIAVLLSAPAMGSAARAAEVTHFAGSAVRAAFERGAPLLEVEDYKIHASRREAPGQAELHELDTDIIYVLEGKATLVTGGSMVAGRATAVHEIRGDSIRDGQARQLAPGDVIVVPHGTPHWFQEVRGPLLYYVVKVPTGRREAR